MAETFALPPSPSVFVCTTGMIVVKQLADSAMLDRSDNYDLMHTAGLFNRQQRRPAQALLGIARVNIAVTCCHTAPSYVTTHLCDMLHLRLMLMQVALDGVSVNHINPDVKLPKAAVQELQW